MSTLRETIWVHDRGELDNTVRNLVERGGQVQYQADDSVTLFLEKKMNVAVLIIGLVLCIIPGLVYLAWYTWGDQSQEITVRIGQPPNLAYNVSGESTHWYDQPAVDGASPGTVPRPKPAAPEPPPDPYAALDQPAAAPPAPPPPAAPAASPPSPAPGDAEPPVA